METNQGMNGRFKDQTTAPDRPMIACVRPDAWMHDARYLVMHATRYGYMYAANIYKFVFFTYNYTNKT